MAEYDWSRLRSLGFSEEVISQMDFACWSGYKQEGVKKKGNRMVPNCVPKGGEEHGEQFDINKPNDLNDMAIGNALPKVPATGPVKNPQMGEQKIRMPRMEEIKKANANNGQLAMAAAPNYSETEDFHDAFHSLEPNGGMAINQLRVMREKIDIMLGMLYPDDNLEPWMATKLSMSAQNLASVADYMRFGAEL
jgi:hypothetical protein